METTNNKEVKMSTANETTESNKVVLNITLNVNISGNVNVGNGNSIVEYGAQSNKSIEKKSALGELFDKVGKIIVKIVGKIKTMFLPRV